MEQDLKCLPNRHSPPRSNPLQAHMAAACKMLLREMNLRESLRLERTTKAIQPNRQHGPTKPTKPHPSAHRCRNSGGVLQEYKSWAMYTNPLGVQDSCHTANSHLTMTQARGTGTVLRQRTRVPQCFVWMQISKDQSLPSFCNVTVISSSWKFSRSPAVESHQPIKLFKRSGSAL